MSPAWVKKVPWATIAEFFLSWWKNRKKKNDNPQGDSQNQEINDRSTLGIGENRPTQQDIDALSK